MGRLARGDKWRETKGRTNKEEEKIWGRGEKKE